MLERAVARQTSIVGLLSLPDFCAGPCGGPVPSHVRLQRNASGHVSVAARLVGVSGDVLSSAKSQRQMFSAVAWLHDLGICHRDLSLENILLQKSADSGSDGLQVKLIDFGMSTLQRHTCNEIRGKQSYQAPEMHRKDEDYDGFLTDVFALGVVIYCLASQDYPWQSTQPGGCQLFSYVSLKGFRAFLERRKLRKGSGERLIEVFTTPFVDLVAGLTALSPVERFTVGEQCWTQPSAPATQRTAVWDLAWLDDWST